MDDLELIESSQVESHLRAVEEDVARRIKMREQSLKNSLDIREKTIIHTGRILHIDGDTYLSNLKKCSNINTYKQVILNHD